MNPHSRANLKTGRKILFKRMDIEDGELYQYTPIASFCDACDEFSGSVLSRF
jgi:hypothetical protein